MSRGEWIQTYTGAAFYPMDPRPEDVRIVDIAHALAHQCRFAGHTVDFYSVAEHSLHVAQIVPKAFRLAALLHDATEAYVLDLPGPIKDMLPDYREMENRVWAAIVRRFDLPLILPPAVKYADKAMLATEGRQALTPPWTAPLPPAADVILGFWTPEKAKRHFLRAFEEFAQ